ncbi:uncharacterized protein MCYG_07435 [Microsporum canis CBS 113480]|uniref:Uncharacterized protein n=1 Tax=Arthroderma otae (strain ATCC MYA-4605 / CBS 113480) TaxID=554155 RepID=C5FYL8_ARTOC|nr:uncharacterized protein MCYG_07435 [Microsporum canis CBS 113480]EEQ34616.1 predicted protein [Microsporum canis CBS 113480]
MATVQHARASNHPVEREEMYDSSNKGIYKTLAVISTAINELACTLQQIREQLHGVSSACATEHEKLRSNNHPDHFEIFAIAMKEVQSKAARIEILEQENQSLRDRLIRMIRAGEKSVIPHQYTSPVDYPDRLMSSNASNPNGKRPLIPLHREQRVHHDDNTIPTSTNATSVELTIAPNENELIEDNSSDAEVEEIPESSNGQINDQSAENEKPTVSEEASEKPTLRHNPARRRRGTGLKSALEQTVRSDARPTSVQSIPQNENTTKAVGDDLMAERPTISEAAMAGAMEAGGKEAATTFDPVTRENGTSYTRETRFRPPRRLTKRRRGRPKGLASEHPMVEIITPTDPVTAAPRPESPKDTLRDSEDRRYSTNTREDEKEANKKQQAEIAARELLVQAAMQREEAYML